jgi:hypothetical protein
MKAILILLIASTGFAQTQDTFSKKQDVTGAFGWKLGQRVADTNQGNGRKMACFTFPPSQMPRHLD